MIPRATAPAWASGVAMAGREPVESVIRPIAGEQSILPSNKKHLHQCMASCKGMLWRQISHFARDAGVDRQRRCGGGYLTDVFWSIIIHQF